MEPKTLSFDQFEILNTIRNLHCDGRFDVDATFGNGSFYPDSSYWPELRYDLDGALPNVTEASSTSLPLGDGSVRSVVFDPPFLTYVRNGRSGNGGMVMARRFAGYWRYDELEKHYKESLEGPRHQKSHIYIAILLVAKMAICRYYGGPTPKESI